MPPEGSLDAAAVLKSLRAIRNTVGYLSERLVSRPAEDIVDGLRGVAQELGALHDAYELTVTREVHALTLRIAAASDGLGLDDTGRASLVGRINGVLHEYRPAVLEWRWEATDVVRVPVPYEKGAAFRPEGEKGEPNGDG